MSGELARSRKRFERSLAELGEAVEQETGWAPRVGRWVVPVVAGAVGLVAGIALRRNLPRLGRRR